MPWSVPIKGHITSTAVLQMALKELNWTPVGAVIVEAT
jgi:hypothetical protein